MTYEELNVVRNLRKKNEVEEQKLEALKASIGLATTKFTREKKDEKSYTCLDVMPRSNNPTSPTETLALIITKIERKIARLYSRFEEEKFKLINKIQVKVKNKMGQTLLIHRYISCKHFRDIGFLMEFSEGHVYFIHRKILKNLLINVSCTPMILLN